MPNISRPFISPPLTSQPPWPVSTASHLWKWRSSRLVSEPEPKPGSRTNPITVVCVSDTHNTQPCIPAPPPPAPPNDDILLHAGDLSVYGTFKELKAALEWISTLPHRHKVIVAGNHDLLLDRAFVAKHPDRELSRPGETAADLPWKEITYLENAVTTIEIASSSSGGQGSGRRQRKITIYGSPLTPQHGNFAFQYPRGADVWQSTIPPGTDILLTHGPPKGHLDEDGMGGCPFLLAEIWRARPRLVVFGHIHGGRGRAVLTYDAAQRWYEAVVVSYHYYCGSRSRRRCRRHYNWLMAMVGLVLLAACVGFDYLRWLLLGRKVLGQTVVVNAAMTRGRQYEAAGPCFVERI